MVNMTRKELEEFLEQLVATEVKKQLATMKQHPVAKEELVDVKKLCEELKVSRQTVNNWRKSDKTGSVINPCIRKMGGKILYDIAAIRRAIKEHETLFGKGRDYGYKYESTASDEVKRDNRFKAVKWNLMQNKDLTEEDRVFYEQECKWRGEQSLLKRRRM